MLRPLTQDEIKELVNRGYDMYDYQGQPVEMPDPPPTSATAAGMRSAAASAVPALAGGAGFAAGMAGAEAGLAGFAGGPLGFVTVPVGFIAGAGLGYGASLLASKAQEKVLPDSVNQQLALDQQEHPTAALVGSLSTLPLGGLNPSLSGPKAIATAIARRSVNPQEIGIAARQALINSGVGAGLGGIQTAVEQKMRGEDLNAGEIARSVALGTLLTKPNKIGELYRFHPLPERTIDSPTKLAGQLHPLEGQAVEPEPVKLKMADSALNVVDATQKPEVPPEVGMTPEELEAATHTQKATDIRTPYTKEIADKLQKLGLEGMTPEYVGTLNKELLAPHQARLAFDSNLGGNKGQALVSRGGQRVVKVRGGDAGFSPDTIPHEDWHHAYSDWQNQAANGNEQAARDIAHLQRLSKPGLDAVNQERAAAGKKPWDIEEFIVSEQGNEFLNQQLNLQGEGGLKKWWGDTKALLSTRGENPTLEQARRAANFRRVNEVTAPGKAPQLGVVEKKNQEDDQQTADFNRYNELKASLKGKTLTEAIPIATELEALKNKYGGMPPTKPYALNENWRQDQREEIDQLYRRGQEDDNLDPWINKPQQQPLNLAGLNKKIDQEYEQKYNAGMTESRDERRMLDQVSKLNEDLHTGKDWSRNQEDEGLSPEQEFIQLGNYFHEKYGKDKGPFKVLGVPKDHYYVYNKDKESTSLPQEDVAKANRFHELLGFLSSDLHVKVKLQNELTDLMVDQLEKQRIHQKKIAVDADMTNPPEYISQKKAAGRYYPSLKQGYTASENMLDTATHEAFHSFFWENIDKVKWLLATHRWTKNELHKVREAVQHGWPWHAENLAHITKISRAPTGDTPIEYNIQKAYQPDITRAFDEILAGSTQGGDARYFRHWNKVWPVVESVMGKRFTDNYARLFYHYQTNDEGILGTARAKYNRETKSYYQKDEGLKADNVILAAAKLTEPYKKWKLKQAKAGQPTDDDAFRKAWETDNELNDDLATESSVISAIGKLQQAQEKTIAPKKEDTTKAKENKTAGKETPTQRVPTLNTAAVLKDGTLIDLGRRGTHGMLTEKGIKYDDIKYLGYTDGEGNVIADRTADGQFLPQLLKVEPPKSTEVKPATEDTLPKRPNRQQRMEAAKQKMNKTAPSPIDEVRARNKALMAEMGIETTEQLNAEKEAAKLTAPKEPAPAGWQKPQWAKNVESLGVRRRQDDMRKALEQSDEYIARRKREGRFQEDDGINLTTKAEKLLRNPKAHKLPFNNAGAANGDNFTLFNKYQEGDEGLRINDQSRQGLWRGAGAAFDRVREVSVPLSEAFKRQEAYRDKIWGHAQLAISDLQKLDQKAVDKAMALHREIFRHAKESEVNDKIALINKGNTDVAKASRLLTDYYHDKIGNVKRELGYRHNGRLSGLNKAYVPDVLNDRALDTFVNKSQSPEAEQLKRAWVDHVYKESKGDLKMDDIRKNINAYIDALGGNRNNYQAVNFGALRKAEGYGLPESMRENNAITALSKYGRRAANDMATFKELEMNPRIANALHLWNPITNQRHEGFDENTTLQQATQVKDAMKWVTGNFSGTMSRSTPQVQSAVRVVNNALLGTATGLRDTISIPMNALPYITSFQDLGAFMRGISNFRKESRNALATAAKQPNLDKLQFETIADAPDKFSAVANSIATGLRRYQGREALENFNRDVTFAAGKELAKQWIIGAKAGHAGSKEMLKKFDTLVDGDVTKMSGKQLEDALNQIGKNFTDRNQGTYGGRGLPTWMVDSQFAPFFALQKWSIEKSNVIYKDVIKPAVEGKNFVPLLTYTAGTLLTGAAIQKLNELLTNRKAQDPTITEALEAKTPHALASELATVMQLGSFMGIVGDGMKAISDFSHGKTPRNIVSFPTASFVADTGERTMQMIEAIQNGENAFDVITQYSIDLMTKNVQAARMIANHTLNEDNVERSDKFRDMRVFSELEGKPARAIATTNPYMNYSARQFKQTSDVNEAASMLPELVQSVQQQHGQDYEELATNLRRLKSNSYQTFPSPERQPAAFQRYYKYLVATQGKDEADKRLQDYMHQQALNQIKSSMIPSL